MKPSDFADLNAVYRKALDLVGKGSNVHEALNESLRELYPLTHADLSRRVARIFNALKRERGWGDLRTLRELASSKTFPELPGSSSRDSAADPHPGGSVAADLQRVFSVAHAKCRVGFDPMDALDMACTELYPLIHRKVLDAAASRLNACMEREGVSLRAALRILSSGGQ